MVSEWRVPCKGQMGYAGLHGTLRDPYCRVDVGVLMSHKWNREPATTVSLLTMTSPQVISQVSTEDVPLCLRVHSLERVARAFGVPIELLSQTTTEAN